MAKEIEIRLSEEAKKELRDRKEKLACAVIPVLYGKKIKTKPIKELFG